MGTTLKIIQFSKYPYEVLNVEIIKSTVNIVDKYVLKRRGKINGKFEYLTKKLLIVFSHDNTNYLYLGDKTIKIIPEIRYECYCEQSETETSWIKVFDKDQCIFELSYKNNTEPYVDWAGFDDWESGNFANYLQRQFEKLNRNPQRSLFPSGQEKEKLEKIHQELQQAETELCLLLAERASQLSQSERANIKTKQAFLDLIKPEYDFWEKKVEEYKLWFDVYFLISDATFEIYVEKFDAESVRKAESEKYRKMSKIDGYWSDEKEQVLVEYLFKVADIYRNATNNKKS